MMIRKEEPKATKPTVSIYFSAREIQDILQDYLVDKGIVDSHAAMSIHDSTGIVPNEYPKREFRFYMKDNNDCRDCRDDKELECTGACFTFIPPEGNDTHVTKYDIDIKGSSGFEKFRISNKPVGTLEEK